MPPSSFITVLSLRAHFHVVGDVAFYVFDINQQSLPTHFYFAFVSIFVFTALSTVFHSASSPDNSPFLTLLFRSHFWLTGPFNSISLYDSLPQPLYSLLWLTGFKALTN